MASETEICNRALQKVGAKRITSLSQDSHSARACNVAYATCRDAELRAHPWSFAIARATLAADATAPDWGRGYSFQLPTDFLRMHQPYAEDNTYQLDYVIEGQKILTDQPAPLYLRYISQVTDPNRMDVLFREAVAARLAVEVCEELTQSNTKLQNLTAAYGAIISEARRTNAIEKPPQEALEDSWITARS